ncbi:MAG: flagellar biosynthetic protein FliO [Candidatus Lindowbacteria bacterium]|nr:flagellar biosynthetic protein FliO [Candidatus Lindowbacteria bacterium]
MISIKSNKNIVCARILFTALMVLLFVAVSPAYASVGGARGIDKSFFADGGILDEEMELQRLQSLQTNVSATPQPTLASSLPDPKTNLSPKSSESSSNHAPAVVEGAQDVAWGGMRLIFMMVVFGGIIYGLSKFVKKSPFSMWGEGIVKRIAIEALGPNQYLQIIDIGGKVVVIGTSEKGITAITELDEDSANNVKLWKAGRDIESGKAKRKFATFLGALGGTPEEKTEMNGSSSRGMLASARERLDGLAL